MNRVIAVTATLATAAVAGTMVAAARCTKPVTMNTGFGGEAQQVKNHHPAG